VPFLVWKPRERQPTPLYHPRGVILGVSRPLPWFAETLPRVKPVVPSVVRAPSPVLRVKLPNTPISSFFNNESIKFF